jgi:hypothetical protein
MSEILFDEREGQIDRCAHSRRGVELVVLDEDEVAFQL